MRFDIGDGIIPFGDAKTFSYNSTDLEDRNYTRLGTKHNLTLEFGLGFRF